MSVSEGESLIRQNYATDSEAGINKLINLLMHGSYTYLSMSYYYDREDVHYPNISKWMKCHGQCQYEQATTLMEYQNIRGGRLVFQAIAKPDTDEWGSPLEGFQRALNLEKTSNKAFIDLHEIATQNKDYQMCDFLEDKYMNPQVKVLEKIGKLITNLKQVGKGVGEYMFDKTFDS
uniref:Ferritin n=1 Tax=Panagrolaimus superbus TaxID=310955 RepID=A0A914ZA54_9BILA